MTVHIEIEQLDESLLEGTPPCQIKFIYAEGDWAYCGASSVARVRTTCSECGFVDAGFMCELCIADLKNGQVKCQHCLTVLSRWTLT